MCAARPRPEDHLGLARSVSLRMGITGPVMESDEFGDACVALVVACEQYQPSRGEFPNYAATAMKYAIVQGRNILAGRGPGTPRQHWFNIQQFPDDDLVEFSPAEKPRDLARILDVAEAMKQLRPPERQLLIWSYWYDYDIVEIGDILGVSKQAAWVQLKNARQSIAEYLPDRLGS